MGGAFAALQHRAILAGAAGGPQVGLCYCPELPEPALEPHLELNASSCRNSASQAHSVIGLEPA